jgi:hypothetical protein
MDVESNAADRHAGDPSRPPRPKYANALAKMQSRQYKSWGDRLSTEMFVVGTHLFDSCTPRE